jgi:hypothetical protein
MFVAANLHVAGFIEIYLARLGLD